MLILVCNDDNYGYDDIENHEYVRIWYYNLLPDVILDMLMVLYYYDSYGYFIDLFHFIHQVSIEFTQCSYSFILCIV